MTDRDSDNTKPQVGKAKLDNDEKSSRDMIDATPLLQQTHSGCLLPLRPEAAIH